MEKIILASNNIHKIKEFKEMFPEHQLLSLCDIGYLDDIEENGNTFLQNSFIKAKTIHGFIKTKGINASVIADDSGLCVDALNGQPGIFSARYSGKHGDFSSNRAKILAELQGKLDRKAYFICVLVKMYPNGTYLVSEGKTFGTILTEEVGDNSFGYDCLFFSHELQKSFGVATAEEKNRISHRGKAISQLKEKERMQNFEQKGMENC